jgi:hypothetical protein
MDKDLKAWTAVKTVYRLYVVCNHLLRLIYKISASVTTLEHLFVTLVELGIKGLPTPPMLRKGAPELLPRLITVTPLRIAHTV